MESNDHDILIRLDEKVTDIKESLDNHLTHHFRYNLLAWSITASAIIALIIALIKVL